MIEELEHTKEGKLVSKDPYAPFLKIGQRFKVADIEAIHSRSTRSRYITKDSIFITDDSCQEENLYYRETSMAHEDEESYVYLKLDGVNRRFTLHISDIEPID